MREERPHSERARSRRDADAAPDAAFDVAPELFGTSAPADGRRVADDTAR
ncbi:hypothetical protein ACFQMA_16225 [Halosimplex aquaticum]|uniref:Uncharacterized protein n=1 Tax=Halosimplex aquaticum TaxID=3026162 RepID=A0ABD5Y6R6_9EURY|nr:hypothetical protein [Halosimplex aquaticum]